MQILIYFLILLHMTQEKPGGWTLWYTVEQARELALKDAKKKEEEKLKNKIKWNVRKIISKK